MLELVESPTLRNGTLAGVAACWCSAGRSASSCSGASAWPPFAGGLIVGAFRGGLRQQLVRRCRPSGSSAPFGLGARSRTSLGRHMPRSPATPSPTSSTRPLMLGMYLVPSSLHAGRRGLGVRYLNERRSVAVEVDALCGMEHPSAGHHCARDGLDPAPVVPPGEQSSSSRVWSFSPGSSFLPPRPRWPAGPDSPSLVPRLRGGSGWRLYTRFVIVVMLGLSCSQRSALMPLTRRSRTPGVGDPGRRDVSWFTRPLELACPT